MKLVILDRDGVINHDSADYIKGPEEWRPLPHSLDAIACLNRAGYRVVVATNQAGIGRGLFSVQDLHRIHARMLEELKIHGGDIEAIFFCPHTPEDHCECRKPKPGLLLDVAARLKAALGEVYAIGDSQRDLDAARAAGARPLLVRTGNGRLTEQGFTAATAVPVFDDLAGAVAHILGKTPAP
ncbi:MAG: D-glycero-beta-D-manno-heptose 1,7-bisphosphate 7-phosphatase [Gammaproteobacteria bacterium]|nr:D-glycero-beta-D-manno-heptose 1,7-bisphosphate 7-phosphatase [Gammaproteobacteria bacterium]